MDTCSLILCNSNKVCVLEATVRRWSINLSGNLYNRMVQIVAYADDVTILARSPQELKLAFLQLDVATKEFGLEVNSEKTKYMVNTRRIRIFRNIPGGAILF
uniref:Reverse transcriptase domain-containing protein n=1 Tax=Rhodnius prolixus TaxID=13249 RepID=T1HB62_RHOPR